MRVIDEHDLALTALSGAAARIDAVEGTISP